jgi:predicted GIY-YIG superfamily endonuclease
MERGGKNGQIQARGGEYMAGKRRIKRDTYNYTLRDGRKVVYYGVTNDPDRRLRQHVNSGKRFTSMCLGIKVTKNTAEAREQRRITNYRYKNRKNPRYNKN